MFPDFEGRFWLYIKTTFLSVYAVYKIKRATNNLHFPLAVITGFIGEKRVKVLLAGGGVAKVIKKSRTKSSVFKFKNYAFYRGFFHQTTSESIST